MQVVHLLVGTWVLQADGPDAFTANEPYLPLGRTLLTWRALQARGCQVCTQIRISVPVITSRICMHWMPVCRNAFAPMLLHAHYSPACQGRAS